MPYLKRFGTRRVPQSAPIPASGQVPNRAGRFTRAVGARLISDDARGAL